MYKSDRNDQIAFNHQFCFNQGIRTDSCPRINVITGETGAGKSIMLGALGLLMGDRADSKPYGI